MRSTTIRNICMITMTALLISLIPSISEGQEGDVMQRIRGTVIEYKGTRATGEPVPGAEVYIEQEPNEEPMAFTNQTKTNSEGYFEIWQKAGDYRITVKASGFKKYTKVIEVIEGKELPLNIELKPGEDVYDVQQDPAGVTRNMKPGESAILRMQVQNTGSTIDSYNVSIKGDKLSWMSMGSTRSSSVGGPYSQSVSNLEDNGIADIDINITIPDDTDPGNYTFTITTRSYWDPQASVETPLTIKIESVEEEAEDDDASLPFLGLASLIGIMILGGIFKRKRDL
ncbi:MAG: carboxypeptidase regulatory-like domain-containing protein [Thermoplasmatota archaeon]